jgi:hypothetical protein
MAKITTASALARKSGEKLVTTTIDAGTGEVLPPRLTKELAEELERCESVIKKGWGTFLEVGRALATIRDKDLFKGKYDTFDEYWRKELGVSRSYAYSLIESAEVNDQLSAIADIPVKPLNEAQLRELIPVPEAKRVDAWKSAVELAGSNPITARIVRKAAVKFKARNSGKKSKLAKKSAAVRIDLGLALKLLGNAEKLAEQFKDMDILKELAALRELLEAAVEK